MPSITVRELSEKDHAGEYVGFAGSSHWEQLVEGDVPFPLLVEWSDQEKTDEQVVEEYDMFLFHNILKLSPGVLSAASGTSSRKIRSGEVLVCPASKISSKLVQKLKFYLKLAGWTV
jgi:hypothetical protein